MTPPRLSRYLIAYKTFKALGSELVLPEWREGEQRTIMRTYPAPYTAEAARRFAQSSGEMKGKPGQPHVRRIDVPSMQTEVWTYQPATEATERIGDVVEFIANQLAPVNREIMGRRYPLRCHVVPADVPIHTLDIGVSEYELTFDGRPYTFVNGFNALPAKHPDRYTGNCAVRNVGEDWLVVEEFVHELQASLTPEQHRRLERRFDELSASEGPWPTPEWYRAGHLTEFFAGLAVEFLNTPSFFTKGVSAVPMQRRDPEMFQLFRELFPAFDWKRPLASQIGSPQAGTGIEGTAG